MRRIPCGEHEHASPSCPLNPRRGHLHSCAAPAALAADLEVKVCQPPLLPSRLSLSWRLSLFLGGCGCVLLDPWERGILAGAAGAAFPCSQPLAACWRLVLVKSLWKHLSALGSKEVKIFLGGVCGLLEGPFFYITPFFFPNSSLFMVTLAGIFSLCYPPVALVVTAPCHHPPPIFWVVPGLAFMYGFNKLGVLLKPWVCSNSIWEQAWCFSRCREPLADSCWESFLAQGARWSTSAF